MKLVALALAYVALGVTDLALRTAGFRRVARYADAPARVMGPVGPADMARARRYAHLIDMAARHHVLRADCLHRSLVLHAWLRRTGQPCSLRIGVRKHDAELHAHAWVELAGHVVNDRPAAVAAFAPLTSVRAATVRALALDDSRSAAWS